MTSTRRFVLAWVLASVPLPLGLQFLMALLIARGYHAEPRQSLWVWIIALGLASVLAAATAQFFVLARLRRRVRGWIWAELAVMPAGLVVYFGEPPAFLGEAARTIAYAASSTLLSATAQALALWGRRWPPTWMLWLAGRLAITIPLSAAALAVEHVGVSIGQALVSAAATAWLLDRLAFRPQGTPEGHPP